MHNHPYVPWVFSILKWSDPPPDVYGIIHQELVEEIPVTVGCCICAWTRTHPLHAGYGS